MLINDKGLSSKRYFGSGSLDEPTVEGRSGKRIWRTKWIFNDCQCIRVVYDTDEQEKTILFG